MCDRNVHFAKYTVSSQGVRDVGDIRDNGDISPYLRYIYQDYLDRIPKIKILISDHMGLGGNGEQPTGACDGRGAFLPAIIRADSTMAQASRPVDHRSEQRVRLAGIRDGRRRNKQYRTGYRVQIPR